MRLNSNLDFEDEHKAIFMGTHDIALGTAYITRDGAIFFKQLGLGIKKIATKIVLDRNNKNQFDEFSLYDAKNGEGIDKMRVYYFSIKDGKPFNISADTQRRVVLENDNLKKQNQFLINEVEELTSTLESYGIPDIRHRNALQLVERSKKLVYTSNSFSNNQGGSK